MPELLRVLTLLGSEQGLHKKLLISQKNAQYHQSFFNLF